MPKLRQRKDGGYYILSSGDSNSVNTFQTTDDGAEIVKSTGRDLGEFFPDQLFFLLYDLDHLSTTGEEGASTGFAEISNIEWATDELSVESRVEVAIQIVEKHGVDQLFEGDAAEWVLTLLDEPPVFLKPLVEEIGKASGYSYETIVAYSELLDADDQLLESALCAYLQMEGLRSSTFDANQGSRCDREVLGTDGEFIYLKVPDEDTFSFGISGEIPESASEGIKSELSVIWGQGVGAAGLAALASMEVERRYDVEHGMVLPSERLEDYPIDIPSRSELTEQYEAFRLLQKHVEHVLSSSEAGVEFDDGSYCDQWHDEIHERLVEGSNGQDGLGEQQGSRVDHTAKTYRDCYGDGNQVTDFTCVEVTLPNESQQLRLFGFGVFDHGTEVQVPVAPDSEAPLPVYPQSQQELDHAIELLDEFPSRPVVGQPTP